MDEKKLKKLKKEIEDCKIQLKDLEPYIYSNAAVAENYNRILIKKAIFIDRYKKLSSKKIMIFSKIANLFKLKKESKLICDYFPNS